MSDSEPGTVHKYVEIILQTPRGYRFAGVLTVLGMTWLHFWGPEIPILNPGVAQKMMDTTSAEFLFAYFLSIPAFVVLGMFAGSVYWQFLGGEFDV